MSPTRTPAVAGQFYAGKRHALEEQIEAAFGHPVGPGRIPEPRAGDGSLTGLISPHAGYPYSGPVAAHGFKALAEQGRPETAVLVGPNHTRFGSPLAISAVDAWETPLGTVPIDKALRDRLASEPGMAIDESTHEGEHSLEVQVPFLQYLFDEPVPILPIVMSKQDVTTVEQLATAFEAIEEIREQPVLIASTDLTHYEPASAAEQKDKPIREAIETLDHEQIMRASEQGHTMCGAGPTAAVLRGAEKKGKLEGEILQYATSGDTAGDTDSVVGYVSAAIR